MLVIGKSIKPPFSSGVKSLLLSLPCTEEKRDEWELVYQMDQRNGQRVCSARQEDFLDYPYLPCPARYQWP